MNLELLDRLSSILWWHAGISTAILEVRQKMNGEEWYDKGKAQLKETIELLKLIAELKEEIKRDLELT